MGGNETVRNDDCFESFLLGRKICQPAEGAALCWHRLTGGCALTSLAFDLPRCLAGTMILSSLVAAAPGDAGCRNAAKDWAWLSKAYWLSAVRPDHSSASSTRPVEACWFSARESCCNKPAGSVLRADANPFRGVNAAPVAARDENRCQERQTFYCNLF